jgi:NAD(P)-dependent dehydrogenase (short-subunit alcohol dehydrogenase family)
MATNQNAASRREWFWRSSQAFIFLITAAFDSSRMSRGYRSEEFPMEAFDEVLSINLSGVFLFSQCAIRHFLERKIKGIIINNSSNHESEPKPGFIAYSISKGGLDFPRYRT